MSDVSYPSIPRPPYALDTPSDAIHYLMERRFLTGGSAVTQDASVSELSRRNRIFTVSERNGPSYFLKQSYSGVRTKSVAMEAQVYKFFARLTEARLLNAYIPRYYHFDAENDVLLLQYYPSAPNLWTYHLARTGYSRTLARALGTALGVIHRVAAIGRLDQEQRHILPELKSSVIPLYHRPSSQLLREVGSGALELIKMIHSSPLLCERTEALRADWEVASLIHRDLKFDNCLAYSRSGSQRKSRIKIVDWEFGGFGDPCWDTASIISDYLLFWLQSLPLRGDEHSGDFLDLATKALYQKRPPIHAFLESYFKALQVDEPKVTERLEKTGRFLSGKLIDTAINLVRESEQPTYQSIALLQLAANISENPEIARRLIFGL